VNQDAAAVDIRKLANALVGVGLVEQGRPATVLAEMLADRAYHVHQAIQAWPESPRAQNWLKEQIQEAREAYRRAHPARRGARDRSHLSAVPDQPQAPSGHEEPPPPTPPGEQGAGPAPSNQAAPARAPQPNAGGAPRDARSPQASANAGAPDAPTRGGNLRHQRREGYNQIHIYAKRAALTFEESETRQKDNGNGGLPTVTVDAAPAGAQPRSYRWSDKIRFQVTPRELPFVAAVFLGYLKAVEFKNHGENNDKGLWIEDQSERGTIFVKVFAKGANHPVPVSAGDIPAVAALLIRQLSALTGLEGAELIALVRACSRFYKAPAPRQQQGGAN